MECLFDEINRVRNKNKLVHLICLHSQTLGIAITK